MALRADFVAESPDTFWSGRAQVGAVNTSVDSKDSDINVAWRGVLGSARPLGSLRKAA
jgi:hypothetical protein